MIPLKNIPGAECLPQEKEEYTSYGKDLAAFNFNKAIKELGQVRVCVDIEELARILFEDRQKELYGEHFLTYRELVELGGKDEWINKAKSIAANPERFLRLEKNEKHNP